MAGRARRETPAWPASDKASFPDYEARQLEEIDSDAALDSVESRTPERIAPAACASPADPPTTHPALLPARLRPFFRVLELQRRSQSLLPDRMYRDAGRRRDVEALAMTAQQALVDLHAEAGGLRHVKRAVRVGEQRRHDPLGAPRGTNPAARTDTPATRPAPCRERVQVTIMLKPFDQV